MCQNVPRPINNVGGLSSSATHPPTEAPPPWYRINQSLSYGLPHTPPGPLSFKPRAGEGGGGFAYEDWPRLRPTPRGGTGRRAKGSLHVQPLGPCPFPRRRREVGGLPPSSLFCRARFLFLCGGPAHRASGSEAADVRAEEGTDRACHLARAGQAGVRRGGRAEEQGQPHQQGRTPNSGATTEVPRPRGGHPWIQGCMCARRRYRRGGGVLFCEGVILPGKFWRGKISPPLQIPKLTLPHAHTALPNTPDFARNYCGDTPLTSLDLCFSMSEHGLQSGGAH